MERLAITERPDHIRAIYNRGSWRVTVETYEDDARIARHQELQLYSARRSTRRATVDALREAIASLSRAEENPRCLDIPINHDGNVVVVPGHRFHNSSLRIRPCPAHSASLRYFPVSQLSGLPG